MTSESDFNESKSLHYTVKAFLYSAPLVVQIEQNGELKKVRLFSSFKFPPPLGPQKKYELNWIYGPGEVEISEVWAEKARGPVKIPRSEQKLDLVQFFWGERDGLKPFQERPVLWRGDDVTCRELKQNPHDFSFVIERSGKKLVEAEGQWGQDGLLAKMKLSLSSPIKLGAITVQRDDLAGR